MAPGLQWEGSLPGRPHGLSQWQVAQVRLVGAAPVSDRRGASTVPSSYGPFATAVDVTAATW
jgi:hypothetical protein